MARRITLDQLAAMVARGFEDVRREMGDLRRELRAEMQEGFASLRAIVDGHTATLGDHSHRLDRIELKLDSSVARLDDHDVRIQVLEKRRGPRS